MKISMHEVGGSKVLAGALAGRKTLAKLLDRTGMGTGEPEPTYLDFRGVEVATASFLRESVLEFRDSVRRRRSNIYPIVANANEGVEEELRVLLSSQGGALMLCRLSRSRPSQPRLIGELDPKQRLTLDLVHERGRTDAADLMREKKEEGILQTAWNNRLTVLAQLGLVIEESRGRLKTYRPLFPKE